MTDSLHSIDLINSDNWFGFHPSFMIFYDDYYYQLNYQFLLSISYLKSYRFLINNQNSYF